MNSALVDQVAEAILYEGYVLYPYRPSSIKNRQRWSFGGLSPRAYAEARGGAERWFSQTECLVRGTAATTIDISARLLHLVARQAATPIRALSAPECVAANFSPVAALKIGDRVFQTWQEAIERRFHAPRFALGSLSEQPQRRTFSFPSMEAIESLRDSNGQIAGAFIRKQNALEGALDLSAEPLGDSLFRLRIQLLNLGLAPNADRISRDEAMMLSLVSSHLVLHLEEGEFVSLLDPPQAFQDAVTQCQNMGCFPVLVGNAGQRSTMLSSPVILYDYPEIAPESPGNLFDGTEIDEILALRILTLTGEEKAEMRDSDERTRALLERVESHPEHLANLHGTMRNIRSVRGKDT